MAADPFETLRLTLMQDVLPVGLAVVERARKGGPRQVIAAFDGTSSDPLDQLRQEGEPAAGQVRENLDRIQPGLGNPVMRVEVRDLETEAEWSVADPGVQAAGDDEGARSDPAELQATLARISARLEALERRLAPGKAPLDPSAHS